MDIYRFLTTAEGFEWDDGNVRKNEKHGISWRDAEEIFFNEPVLVVPDPRHSDEEPRFHALGRTRDGRLLHATFTVRDFGKKIRVISARPMHRKERVIYAQALEDDS